MRLNHDGETTQSESLISLDEEKIKNVLEFKYLGVILSPEKPQRLIEHRIASATAKFHELRKILISEDTGSIYECFFTIKIMLQHSNLE